MTKKLYPEERLMRIMKIIREENAVTVGALTDLFDVSGATVRADLRELERRRLITRTHGGAVLREILDEQLLVDRDPTYENRLEKNRALKEAIGRAAAGLLVEGDSVMLDDGSTTIHVARHIPDGLSVNVLTNGLNICIELMNHPRVEVIATGGTLKRSDVSYYGRLAEEVAGRFQTSRAILGASGISPVHGVTAPSEEKAALKRVMIEHSGELVLVADHTKLNRVTLLHVCPLREVDVLVTDSDAPADVVDQIRGAGVRVILAG
jgi:DeoR family fructose operon transcriptional repressor